MTPITVTSSEGASSRAPIDMHREAMERLAKEPTRAELAAERARCEAAVHACDMADCPSLADVQDARRAASRISEIDGLIGKSDGTPEQQLQAMKIALESIVIHLTTRGTPMTAAGGQKRIAYDASFVEFQVSGMNKLIRRLS